MKVSSKHFRRGGMLIALTGSGALVALGSAGAFVGGTGSAGPPATNAPDLLTVTVTRSVDPTAAAGPQLRYCFDGPIATILAANGMGFGDYGTKGAAIRATNASSAVVDPQDPNCVVATFPNGEDVDQMSYAGLTSGALQGNGNVAVPAEAAPITQAAGATYGLRSEAGHTTGPELVSAAVTGQKEITYTFDEKIDPTPGAAYSAASFAYYINSSNGGAPIQGTGPVVINGNTAIIQFTTAITSAVQYVVAPGAVQDVDTQFGANEGSTIGNAGLQITGSPGLDGAVKNSDNQSVNLHFSQGVNPGAAGAIFAYREDGTPIAADSVTTTNDSNNQTLKATFPVSLQKDPNEVVRVGLLIGAATARSGPNNVTVGAAAIGTCKCTYGYTDGPDLLNTTIDDAGNTATFFFDEPVSDTPQPVAGNFALLQPDGTTIPGLDSVVVSADHKSVQVHFGSSVSATVGVSILPGTVRDEGPEANVDSYSDVGIGAPQNGQTGSTGTPTPVGTATVAPTATVTVAPTATPKPSTSKKTKLKSVKVSGKKVKGKVSASSPCKKGRTVKVKKGSKTLGSGKSKSSGSFSIKLKSHKKGHLKLTVSTRHVGSTTCKSVSKKISGKH